jgi:small nuclear ribonucleoprotein (snRNP)-like protein
MSGYQGGPPSAPHPWGSHSGPGGRGSYSNPPNFGFRHPNPSPEDPRPCCSAPGCLVRASLRRPAPVAMNLTSPAALVTVRVLLHDGQLIRGVFVSFDPVWNPILRDCVEVHPQAGRHVPGPLVFPCAAIASLAVEPVSSPSLPSASVGAPSLALSAHTVPSPLPPPRTTTDWVVDSGASFHTTPPLIRYSTPIHPTPHILPPSPSATVPPSRSPQ